MVPRLRLPSAFTLVLRGLLRRGVISVMKSLVAIVDWDSSCPVDDLKTFLQSLWAPWRVEYFERPGNSRDFLRRAAESTNDVDHYVVYRRKSSFLVTNLYPYSAGHLMAVPYREISTLEELATSEKLELIDLSIYAQHLLRDVVKAEAFNIGWNLGAAAGAGLRRTCTCTSFPAGREIIIS